MNYLRISLALALLSLGTQRNSAELPPPERLVGAETTLLVTVPDWSSAVDAFEKTSTSGLLKDPAMKPLIDKIVKDFKESITSQVDRKDKDYLDEFLPLIKGQVTFVMGDLREIAKNPSVPPVTFIFDVKDRQADLADYMDRSLKDEEDAQVVREKVAGGEIVSLISKESGPSNKPKKMFFGIADSMLGVSFKKESVVSLIRRKNGDLQNSLAENPTFRADQARFFRHAKGYLWANVEEIVKLAKANIEQPKAGGGNPFAMSLDVGRLLDALGLNGWKSLALASDFDSRGADMQLFLNVPESGRKGLFKLLETEHRATGPPIFVTDDVAKFVRWRKSGEEALQILEKTVAEAVPPFAGFVTMMIDQAGKMKNPNFDFRRQFIGNLGDDIITIQKTAKQLTIDAMATPPTLYLVGSGNPDALLDAMMTAQSSMGIPGMNAKEEEFLGKRIFALPAGVKTGIGGQAAGQRHLYATTARGYMAIGTERELVEDFIRGGSKANGLAEIAGFREAAEKVGGLGTGWFFYENPAETLNLLLTSFKENPNALQSLFGPTFFKAILVNPGSPAGAQPQVTLQERIADYVKLFPEFKQIAKYLSFSVGRAMTDAEGILVRSHTPDRSNR